MLSAPLRQLLPRLPNPIIPRRLPERRPMTIIAGFACRDGFLFAADTKHSIPGWMQMEAGKLFTNEYPCGGRTLFAISGHVHYAKMMVQHCERQLSELSSEQFTLDSCRSTIERVICEDYANHIYPHPEPRPSVEFLVGAYSPISKMAGMFSTEETSVNRLYGYDCRGSGAYLGHFLLRDTYKHIRRASRYRIDRVHEIHQITLHVIHAIRRIKSYDDSCGNATDIGWIGHNGFMGLVTRLFNDGIEDEHTVKWLVKRLTTGQFPTDAELAHPRLTALPAKPSSSLSIRTVPKRDRKRRKPSQE